MMQTVIRPESLENAVNLKKEKGTDAVFLAGATHVNSGYYKGTASTAILLDKLLSKDIVMDAVSLKIGAMASIQDLVDSDAAPGFLRESAKLVYSRSIRNQGTIGGNLAAQRGDSPLIPAFMALGAELEFSDKSRMLLKDYLVHSNEKIIGYIHIEHCAEKNLLIKKFAKCVSGIPYLYVALASRKNSEAWEDLTLAVSGFGVQPLYHDKVSAAIEAGIELDAVSDIHGSKEYKSYLVAVTVKDMLRKIKQGGTQ